MLTTTKITRPTNMVKSISCIWLVLWLVAIPLIHVHPEADHAHGAQDHKHGGLFHSVLSQDLACEFHNHHSDNTPLSEKIVEGLLHCHHAHAHQLTHDEIGFSLLSGSSNDSFTGHGSPIFFLSSTGSSPLAFLLGNQSLSPGRSPPTQLLVTIHHIRPPPIYSA